MYLPDFFRDLYDLVFRLLPNRTPTGLIRIGHPGPDDPVLVSGNYTLTVRRLRRCLAGFNAWLLAADSKGINVWCAAGGGHFTHHDVIAIIRTSGISEQVTHRRLILPQLGATGIERRKIYAATGWEVKWGPAHMGDLPGYLRRKQRVKRRERVVRFPLRERLEMAAIWVFPFLIVSLPVAFLVDRWPSTLAVAIVIPALIIGLFALLPWTNMRGSRRWINFALLMGMGFGLGFGGLALFSDLTGTRLLLTGTLILLAVFSLSLDFEGTTPLYSSVINTFRNRAHIDLVSDRCSGEADCVLVCPRDVFKMRGDLRKVEVTRLEDCVQCGACIVQCPRDALRFRYDDGRIVTPDTIRRTRLNLIARRTVLVEPEGESGSSMDVR